MKKNAGLFFLGLWVALAAGGCSLLVEDAVDDTPTQASDTHSDTGSDSEPSTSPTDPVTDPGSDSSTGDPTDPVTDPGSDPSTGDPTDPVTDSSSDSSTGDPSDSVTDSGSDPSTGETGGTDDTSDTGDTGVPNDTVLGECQSNEECDDLNPCNGYEKCDFETYLCFVEPGADNGTGCTLPWSPSTTAECLNGECVEVACPNGTRTVYEECDDGNTIEGDGCENDCRYSCHSSIECDDGNPCNGSETCDTVSTFACQASTEWPPPGDNCGENRSCNNAGECAPDDCGNCTLNGEEDCDDCNPWSDDGCESDCTWTCSNNEDCADGDVCNGDEFCDAFHLCHGSQELTCPEPDPCHVFLGCDPVLGCLEGIVDNDGDGYGPTSGGCGEDCDDGNEYIHPGVADPCDDVDNDCDTLTDEDGPYWYRDCDADGFAPAFAESIRSCELPLIGPTSCPGGAWTSIRPVGDNIDCCDAQPEAFPEQSVYFDEAYGECNRTTWDYNCNGEEDFAIPSLWDTSLPCTRVRNVCVGHMWAPTVTKLPGCGDSASARLCKMNFLGVCVRSATSETVTQLCH